MPLAGPDAPVEVRLAAGGLDRRYLLWQPASVRRGAPLLLLLHGYTGTPEHMAAGSALPPAATRRGWVVVAPAASGSPSRWPLPGQLDGPDDVAFVTAVIADAADRTCADAGHVVVAGWSNGAGFAGVLACRIPLAGVVMVGGAGLTEPCDVPDGLRMLAFHGTADPVVPYPGGPVLQGLLHSLPFDAAVDGWRRGGAAVTATAVPGGGHEWPAGANEALLATFAV